MSTDLKIAFCGDIMLGSEVARCMGISSVREWLQGVSKTWYGARLVIANLECPCVQVAEPVADGRPAELVLHAPASRTAELASAGFSAVTLANNHILDCGSLGLLETIRSLDDAGIAHAGAGMYLSEALRPAFMKIGRMTVGLVAFCYGPAASPSTAGAAPCEPKLMRKALADARAGADLVIAALHDGLEYSDVPPSQTRARFRFLAENGADIVVGHHPHVLQGLEWYGNVPVAYSLGDLLFDNSLPRVMKGNFSRMAIGRFAPHEVQRDPMKFHRGAVMTVQISGGQKIIQWHPFRQDQKLRPQLSTGSTKTDDLRRLDDLSEALLNANDPRHALADAVLQMVERENLDILTLQDLLKLACRPKWRYASKGLKWLWRRMNYLEV